MVCNILYGLRIFDNLKTIKLTASTLITLRNQSENKLLILQDNYEAEAGEVETSTGHEMVLGGISGLLGDHLTDIKLSGGGLDSTIVRLLEKSKSTLERIDLSESEIEDCEQEIIELVTDCPNLVSLNLGFPAHLSSEETRPRFSIPPTFKHLSKLEHLVITGDIDFTWEDQSLYVWFGKRLITLKIDFYIHWQQERFLNQTQIDRQLFSSFLRPLSSTLTTLDLASLFLEAPRSQKEGQDSSSEAKLEMEA